jgi:hypothetical protein
MAPTPERLGEWGQLRDTGFGVDLRSNYIPFKHTGTNISHLSFLQHHDINPP